MADDNSTAALDLALYQATNQAGQAAIRSAILVSGGASVALLAFLGRYSLELTEALATQIPWALLSFVGATLLAAIASGCTYAALMGEARNPKRGRERSKIYLSFNWLAICFVALSYLAFATGGWLAFRAFIAI